MDLTYFSVFISIIRGRMSFTRSRLHKDALPEILARRRSLGASRKKASICISGVRYRAASKQMTSLSLLVYINSFLSSGDE